ncbi:MAG TPA: peptide ABC transporter permease [Bacteroidetes bacterium]|nr:peptide ABC transporter permease [Bacteroidota bacterium]
MRYYFSEFKEGMLIAFQAIRANKMRSVLTTLGIVIGIVSVTLMGTAIEGLDRAFNKSIAAIGADVLYVQKWPWGGGHDWWTIRNRKDIRIQHAKVIERQATLAKSVSPVTATRRNVKYERKVVESVVIMGTDADFTETSGATIAFGRFLTPAEADGGRPVCALGSEVAVNLFPNENPIGKVVKVGNYAYRVVGVFDKQGSFLGMESLDNRVYVPINRFFKEFMSGRGGISVFVKAASLQQVDDAKEEVRGILRKARGLKPKQQDDFAINQQEIIIQTFNTIGVVIAGVGLFITGLSLFVGGIGIMNIMLVSVSERTKEIGLRKAIGATSRAVLLQFLIEAVIVSVVGGVIGILIGAGSSLLLSKISGWAVYISPFSVALAFGFSAGVGIVFGFWPAKKASLLSPIEALRYE